jgi:hypothetical protein
MGRYNHGIEPRSRSRGGPAVKYSTEIEQAMRSFYASLSERARRRYAAIEAAKLGHGGVEYITSGLGCDPTTIRPGQDDLGHLPADLGQRVRKKGVDASGA